MLGFSDELNKLLGPVISFNVSLMNVTGKQVFIDNAIMLAINTHAATNSRTFRGPFATLAPTQYW